MEGVIYEYATAANPSLSKIPIKSFNLCDENKYNIFTCNLQKELNTFYPATTPSLLAEVVHLKEYDNIKIDRNSFSQLFYVIKGSGTTLFNDSEIEWNQGDIFITNSNLCTHKSTDNSSLLMISDEPLLNYMGLTKRTTKFRSCIFTKSQLYESIKQISNENENRCGILLGIKETENTTQTISPSLWCLFNKIPPNSVQKPHRHNSVALDFCVYAPDKKVYTLIGYELDSQGNISNPQKVYWNTNTLFITPPGLWHSHHNESEETSWIIPVQDAGIHTYLRTLNISFAE